MKSVSKYIYIGAIAAMFLTACSKNTYEPQIDENNSILEPIDLILNLEYEDNMAAESRANNSNAVSINLGNNNSAVTKQTTLDSDTEIVEDTGVTNVHVFMFYKKNISGSLPHIENFSRHYYVSSLEDMKVIKMPNLYVGYYEMFVIANNGEIIGDIDGSKLNPNGEDCSITQNEILKLWSEPTIITTRNIMTFYSSSVLVDRFREGDNINDHSFTINLEKKTAKIGLNLTNRYPAGNGNDDYIAFTSFSFANIVQSIPLYDNDYVSNPGIEQLTNSSVTKITKQNYENYGQFIRPNEKGYGQNATTQADRNYENAPEGASALIISLDYYEPPVVSKLSYVIYLGQTSYPYGLNNYNVFAKDSYNYEISVGSPNYEDPRLMFMTVTNEKEKFKLESGYEDPHSGQYRVGTILSRPLNVKYTRLLNNSLLLTVDNPLSNDPEGSYFQICDSKGNQLPNDKNGLSAKATKIVNFVIDDRYGEATGIGDIHEVDLIIKYSIPETANITTSDSNLAIKVSTSLGLERYVEPEEESSLNYQTVVFYKP